eukprot:5184225-Amphidinium_carterae.1
MEMVSERLLALLYAKFVNSSFTMAAFRMLCARRSAKRMTPGVASVLLSYTWLVATLFGPCLPILNALLALFAMIYSVLLFGSDVEILGMSDSHGQLGPPETPHKIKQPIKEVKQMVTKMGKMTNLL